MLQVGAQAPDFDVSDHLGSKHSLTKYKGRRFVVYFYPKADTPG